MIVEVLSKSSKLLDGLVMIIYPLADTDKLLASPIRFFYLMGYHIVRKGSNAEIHKIYAFVSDKTVRLT